MNAFYAGPVTPFGCVIRCIDKKQPGLRPGRDRTCTEPENCVPSHDEVELWSSTGMVPSRERTIIRRGCFPRRARRKERRTLEALGLPARAICLNRNAKDRIDWRTHRRRQVSREHD
jgi:hypothetical protein